MTPKQLKLVKQLLENSIDKHKTIRLLTEYSNEILNEYHASVREIIEEVM